MPRAEGDTDAVQAEMDLLDQTVGAGRHQLLRALQVHHVDLVVAHVLFQRGGQLRAFGVGHGDEVLDADGVHHLATETFGDNGGANAFAGGIHRSSIASRART